jgi:hypothetical protein
MGGFHICWAILVLLGGAQPLINFIFWAHMIRPIYVIQPFDLAAAVTLVILTASIGYISGFIGGAIWNRNPPVGRSAQ